jgi:hypothetical protein
MSSLRFQPSTSGILVYSITSRPTLLAGRPSYNTVAKCVNFMEDSSEFKTTYYKTGEVGCKLHAEVKVPTFLVQNSILQAFMTKCNEIYIFSVFKTVAFNKDIMKRCV